MVIQEDHEVPETLPQLNDLQEALPNDVQNSRRLSMVSGAFGGSAMGTSAINETDGMTNAEVIGASIRIDDSAINNNSILGPDGQMSAYLETVQ